MLPVLTAMVSGMIAGFLIRKHRRIFLFLNPAIAWIIRLLLFLLGFGIGSDKNLLSRVPSLGFKGIVLAFSAIGGSVLAARFIVGGKTTEKIEKTRIEKVVGSQRLFSWRRMRGSVIAVAAFSAGLPAGVFFSKHCTGIPRLSFDPAEVVLYLLMFMVGMGVAADSTVFSSIKRHGIRLVLLPLAVIIGTLTGVLLPALIWPSLPIRESLAVGAGFGYYSLSSLIIREISGGDWAALALLSNIFREILTLLAAPLLVKVAGPSAPAAAGGATSMDTTLAATVQYSGGEWTVPALFSGVVLTLLTPFLVTLILTL